MNEATLAELASQQGEQYLKAGSVIQFGDLVYTAGVKVHPYGSTRLMEIDPGNLFICMQEAKKGEPVFLRNLK